MLSKIVGLLRTGGQKFHAGLNALFPAPPLVRSRVTAAEALGLFGLLCLFVGLGPSKALQNAGMTFMVLALLISWRSVLPALRRDPLTLTVLLWIGYLVLNAALATWGSYGGDINHFEDVRSLSRFYLVILIAWWLGQSPKALQSALMLALFGLLVVIFQEVAAHGWNFGILIDGGRLHFVRNAQDFGLFAAAALLALLFLMKRIIGPFSQHKAILALRIVLWASITVLVAISFAAAEVRSQWLALGLVAVLTTALLLGSSLLAKPFRATRLLAPVGVVLAAALLLFSQWDRATDRWQREAHIFPIILEGDLQKVPTSSVGHRIHLWSGAISAIGERPWLGWGPSSTENIINTADIPKRTKNSFGHFHNSYLDITVRTGLIGLAFMATVFVLVLRALWKGYRSGAIEGDMALFYLGALVVLVVGNATESFIRFQFGWFFMAAIMALIYRHSLSHKEKQ